MTYIFERREYQHVVEVTSLQQKEQTPSILFLALLPLRPQPSLPWAMTVKPYEYERPSIIYAILEHGQQACHRCVPFSSPLLPQQNQINFIPQLWSYLFPLCQSYYRWNKTKQQLMIERPSSQMRARVTNQWRSQDFCMGYAKPKFCMQTSKIHLAIR